MNRPQCFSASGSPPLLCGATPYAPLSFSPNFFSKSESFSFIFLSSDTSSASSCGVLVK